MGTEKTLPSWARVPKQSGRIFLEIKNDQIGKTRICIDEKPGYLLGRSRKVRHLIPPSLLIPTLLDTALCVRVNEFTCRIVKSSVTQSLAAGFMPALRMTERGDFILQT